MLKRQRFDTPPTDIGYFTGMMHLFDHDDIHIQFIEKGIKKADVEIEVAYDGLMVNLGSLFLKATPRDGSKL